jgi:hypothetical protein
MFIFVIISYPTYGILKYKDRIDANCYVGTFNINTKEFKDIRNVFDISPSTRNGYRSLCKRNLIRQFRKVEPKTKLVESNF